MDNKILGNKIHQPVKDCVWMMYPYGDITQWYGKNKDLYSKHVCFPDTNSPFPPDGQYCLQGHNGIDIVRPWGEHLFAVEDAIIAEVNHSPTGYGKHIRIRSLDNEREWVYGHCSEIIVEVGQIVKGGQHIGNMGNTGFVVSGYTPYWGYNPYAGTHLHLGFRRLKGGIVQDYYNGLYGFIDQRSMFLTRTSERVELAADISGDATTLLFARLLSKIGM